MPNYADIKKYSSKIQPTWCGGCGNFGIWASIKRALVEMEIEPEKVLFCFDIGCNGNMNDKIGGYRFHGLHGRVLPVAVGAKIANEDLIVIASAGDGATYSEGIGHFIHTLRNEYPITFLVHDNENYGLTTGQCSATTREDVAMNSSPDGNTGKTMNPLELALSQNPSFMAQAFSGDIEGTKEILKLAIKHQIEGKGLSYVNILQSCPTYNKVTGNKWYMERIKNVDSNLDVGDINKAREIIQNISKDIPVGVIYKNPKAVSYLSRLSYRGSKSLLVNEVKKDITSIKDLLTELV